jgi:hypothetical protein
LLSSSSLSSDGTLRKCTVAWRDNCRCEVVKERRCFDWSTCILVVFGGCENVWRRSSFFCRRCCFDVYWDSGPWITLWNEGSFADMMFSMRPCSRRHRKPLSTSPVRRCRRWKLSRATSNVLRHSRRLAIVSRRESPGHGDGGSARGLLAGEQ